MTKKPRVVLGIDDTPAGWAALRAAVELARQRDAVLYAVRVLPAAAAGRTPVPVLRTDLVVAAATLVHDSFLQALGGVPAGLSVQVATVDGPVGPALVALADRESDVLVVGGRRRHRTLGHQPGRYCVAHAVCPVLVVPPPALGRGQSTRKLARSLRRELDQLLATSDPGPKAMA
ncbi:MAG TPA: universal stress protein, partial [Rugosimonospora sp.]|nr:universal stress protein [Rugosimonospora sp.]